MECAICGKEIDIQPSGWAEGHNAEPVVPGGRCCGRCNQNEVIPARIARFRDRQDEKMFEEYERAKK